MGVTTVARFIVQTIVLSVSLNLAAISVCGADALASETAPIQVSDSPEKQLRDILQAPNLAVESKAQYKGPLAVPPSTEDALRARKEETLRQYREQEFRDSVERRPRQ